MFNQTLKTNSMEKLGTIPEKTRTYFMLIFTKELIKHSTKDFHKLEHTIKKKGAEYIKEKDKKIKKLEEKRKIESRKKEREQYMQSLMHQFPRPDFEQELLGPAPSLFPKQPIQRTPQQIFPHLMQRPPISQPMNIIHPPLPPHLQYLRPIPTYVEIDLGKLQDLADDPNVKMIQCDGPDEPIVIRISQGMRSTNIILDRDEIDRILGAFSEKAKIPLHEGIFKIVVGRFSLSAIISSVVGSKFIINKMEIPPPMMAPFPPRY